MRRWRLTPVAGRDLRNITDYISEHSPSYAGRFVDLFERRCDDLAAMPLSGRAVPEMGPDVRRVPFERNYLIFYRPGRSGVTILNVKHGARRPGSIRKHVRRSRDRGGRGQP